MTIGEMRGPGGSNVTAYGRVTGEFVEMFPVKYWKDTAMAVEPSAEEITKGGWKRILSDNEGTPGIDKTMLRTLIDENDYIILKTTWIPSVKIDA